jgi:hypothetical protein
MPLLFTGPTEDVGVSKVEVGVSRAEEGDASDEVTGADSGGAGGVRELAGGGERTEAEAPAGGSFIARGESE